jgi:hypothetical protein
MPSRKSSRGEPNNCSTTNSLPSSSEMCSPACIASAGAFGSRPNPARCRSSVSTGRMIHPPSTLTVSLWKIIPRNSFTWPGRLGTEGGKDVEEVLLWATEELKPDSVPNAKSTAPQLLQTQTCDRDKRLLSILLFLLFFTVPDGNRS